MIANVEITSSRSTNMQAERALLGRLLRYHTEFADAFQVIPRHDDFHGYAHQCIYRGMMALESSGKPWDMPLVASWLQEQKLIDDVRHDYLMELWDAASIQNAGHIAKSVSEAALIRRVQGACEETLTDIGEDTESASMLAERAEQRFFDLATMRESKAGRPIQELMRETAERLDARRRYQTPPGIKLGWPSIDRWISLRPGEVTVVGARTSVGKTVFALNLAYNFAMDDVSSLFVSLEMGEDELTERLLAMSSQVSFSLMQTGQWSNEEEGRMVKGYSQFDAAKIVINDAPSRSMLQISSEARRLKVKGNLDVVLIDYLQLIRPETRRKDRREEVDEITRRLKLTAKDLKVPIVVLAQVNRGVNEQQEPELSTLRESGSIEQDSDNVIFLHKPTPNDTADREQMAIRIAKQRNGPKARATLMHDKPTFRLYEVAKEWGQ